MTQPELLDLYDNLVGRARAILVTKNQDYRGGEGDPFANFRGSEFLGIDPVIGILLRCQDKFQRIRSFVANGTLAVKEESVTDAVLDVINYMVLVAGLAAERGGPSPSLVRFAEELESHMRDSA